MINKKIVTGRIELLARNWKLLYVICLFFSCTSLKQHQQTNTEQIGDPNRTQILFVTFKIFSPKIFGKDSVVIDQVKTTNGEITENKHISKYEEGDLKIELSDQSGSMVRTARVKSPLKLRLEAYHTRDGIPPDQITKDSAQFFVRFNYLENFTLITVSKFEKEGFRELLTSKISSNNR